MTHLPHLVPVKWYLYFWHWNKYWERKKTTGKKSRPFAVVIIVGEFAGGSKLIRCVAAICKAYILYVAAKRSRGCVREKLIRAVYFHINPPRDRLCAVYLPSHFTRLPCFQGLLLLG